MFEGHQLYCVKVAASSQKKKVPATSVTSSTTLLGPAPQPVLAAMAAAQNLMIHRHNPTFASLLGHNLAAVLNTIYRGAGLLSLSGQGLGGVGLTNDAPSILGPCPYGLKELLVCVVCSLMTGRRSSGRHHPRGLTVIRIMSSDRINGFLCSARVSHTVLINIPGISSILFYSFQVI